MNFLGDKIIIEMLQSSDVTTITDNTKKMAEYMFSQMTPSVIAKINGGIDSGITGISDSITQLTEAINKMPPIPTMKPTIDKMNAGKVQMEDTLVKMKALKEAVPAAFETGKNNYLTEIENIRSTIENEFQTTLNKGFQEVYATVAIASLLAMVVLMLYKEEKKVTTN